MPAIHVNLDGDHEKVGQRLGMHNKATIHTTADWTVDALERGMASGATSLMVLIPANVEGIEVVVAAETSLQVWMMASAALRGRFHEELEQPGWAVLSDATRAALMPRYVEALRRAIPAITAEQADSAAEMLLDALSAGAPPDLFET